jgi:hypothetical protein
VRCEEQLGGSAAFGVERVQGSACLRGDRLDEQRVIVPAGGEIDLRRAVAEIGSRCRDIALIAPPARVAAARPG